jgi:hypothetical protein
VAWKSLKQSNGSTSHVKMKGGQEYIVRKGGKEIGTFSSYVPARDLALKQHCEVWHGGSLLFNATGSIPELNIDLSDLSSLNNNKGKTIKRRYLVEPVKTKPAKQPAPPF